MIRNYSSNNEEFKKGLYVVSTPIGNLEDITLRAIKVLNHSNYILCEDTRVSKILLDKYNLKSKLIANHKFNEKKNLSRFLQLLKNGSIISLISDAGTPAISDPGAILIDECFKNEINVIPIPGPSSVTTAVSVSGFSEKFFFYGFFPEKKKEIADDLNKLSKLNSSIIFFVSSKKFNRIIPNLKKNFSGRKILICREMTKIYEEFVRIDIDKLDSTSFKFKGELTLVVSEDKAFKKTSQKLDESDRKLISQMIKKFSIREITQLINREKKVPKKEIYNYCIKLKNED